MIGGIFQQAISLDSHRWTFLKTIELTLPAFPWDVFRKYLPIYEWFCFFNDFHGSVNIPIPWMVWVWPLNDWGWFFTIESSETNRPSECRCCCQKGLTKKGLTRLVVSRLRSGTRTQFRPMSSWARFRVWCWVQVWKKKSYHNFIQWNIDSQFSWHMMVAVMKCISSIFFGAFLKGAFVFQMLSRLEHSGLNSPGVHPRQREVCEKSINVDVEQST